MRNKILCIIQARMASSRLPGKILMKVQDVPLLEYELERVRKAKEIDKIVVATTRNKEDDAVVALCKKMGVDSFRGDEEDVLGRYYQCSLRYPEYGSIMRLTGDCPLIDPKVIDEVTRFYKEGDYDYAGNIGWEKETFPNGMDVEIFTREVLEESAKKARLLSEREHITQYMRKAPHFKEGNFAAPEDYSRFRLTVDEPEDFEVIKFIIENSDINDDYYHYMELLEKNPEMMEKNTGFERNDGLLRSLAQDREI